MIGEKIWALSDNLVTTRSSSGYLTDIQRQRWSSEYQANQMEGFIIFRKLISLIRWNLSIDWWKVLGPFRQPPHDWLIRWISYLDLDFFQPDPDPHLYLSTGSIPYSYMLYATKIYIWNPITNEINCDDRYCNDVLSALINQTMNVPFSFAGQRSLLNYFIQLLITGHFCQLLGKGSKKVKGGGGTNWLWGL